MQSLNTRWTLTAIALLVLIAGCGEQKSQQEEEQAVSSLTLVKHDLLMVQQAELSQGPMISGSLQPVTKAELNAEVSGIVTRVLKDNGDLVNKGDVLVELDKTTYRDKMLSAQEAERSALVTADQAAKQLKRMQSLYKQNLVTAEVLESAEIKANQAQSELASARARLVEAKQQLTRTEVKAPFNGVVAARKASAGDTAQIGKALMVVIDPASMRFEGFIAADQVGLVQTGQAVSFKVNGYPNQYFDGVIERINPQANELTRQVQIFVRIDKQANFVAGLYAEGYIAIAQNQAVMLPESAIVREGDNTFAWKLDKDVLRKTRISLGAQDPRFGTYQVKSGLAVGEQVLSHPKGAIRDGIAVTLQTSTPSQAVAESKQNVSGN